MAEISAFTARILGFRVWLFGRLMSPHLYGRDFSVGGSRFRAHGDNSLLLLNLVDICCSGWENVKRQLSVGCPGFLVGMDQGDWGGGYSGLGRYRGSPCRRRKINKTACDRHPSPRLHGQPDISRFSLFQAIAHVTGRGSNGLNCWVLRHPEFTLR